MNIYRHFKVGVIHNYSTFFENRPNRFRDKSFDFVTRCAIGENDFWVKFFCFFSMLKKLYLHSYLKFFKTKKMKLKVWKKSSLLVWLKTPDCICFLSPVLLPYSHCFLQSPGQFVEQSRNSKCAWLLADVQHLSLRIPNPRCGLTLTPNPILFPAKNISRFNLVANQLWTIF